MIENSSLHTVDNSHSDSANDGQTTEVHYERYKRRTDGLVLIRCAIDLLNLIQQHRASSLGVLGGTSHFQSRTTYLQQQIQTRLSEIHQARHFRDQQRWRAIVTEWYTIRQHWHRDTPLDNFELHNFLIEQLTQLTWDIAKQSDLLGHNRDSYLPGEFAFNHLTKYIESLGMLRGLSVYVAATGECQRSYTLRLSHLLQICQEKFAHHQTTLAQLPKPVTQELQRKYSPQEGVRLTNQFFNMVECHILNTEQIQISSDDVLMHATRAIEYELALLGRFLRLLELQATGDV